MTALDAKADALVHLPFRNSYHYPCPVQLLNDRDMEMLGTANWTAWLATLTKSEANPHSGERCLRIAYIADTVAGALQSVMTVGHHYHLTGWARSVDGSSNPAVATNATWVWVGTSSTSWQSFDIHFTDDGNGNIVFCGQFLDTGRSVEFDDLSLVECLLADGDMEDATTTAWSVTNSAVVTKPSNPRTGSPGTKCLRVAWGGVSWPAVYQSSIQTAGRAYRITGWARGDGTWKPSCYSDGGSALLWEGTTSTTWQYFDVTYTAAGTAPYFFANATAAGYVEWDDITIEHCPRVVRNEGKTGGVFQLADGVTTSYFPTIPAADMRRGARFDGSNDYAVFAHRDLSFVREGVDLPFSVELFLRGNDYTVFKGIWNTIPEWGVYTGSGYAYIALFYSPAIYISRWSSAVIDAYNWHHVVWTYNGLADYTTSFKLYVDSVERSTGGGGGAYTSMAERDGTVNIGVIPAVGYYGPANHGHVTIWPWQLSPSEVAQLCAKAHRRIRSGRA